MYPVVTAVKSFRYPLTRPRWGNALGVTIKLTVLTIIGLGKRLVEHLLSAVSSP